MAGQQLIERQSSKPSQNKSHGKNKNKGWPKIPREEKPRERVLPNPIPDQTPVCFTGSKQSPTTRAPTRTPSGEKGPEDSWLRLLSRSDENLPQDRPNHSSL